MADAEPAPPASTAPSQPAASIGRLAGGELALRVISAAVLAPLAVAIAYVGSWLFVAFWGIAAMLVLWEWTALVAKDDQRSALMIGAASVGLALALAGNAANIAEVLQETRLLAAVIVVAMGAIAMAALAPARQRAWLALGIPYAGTIGIAPIVIESDNTLGFVGMIMLFAIVWTTDIVAYFVGRTVGGRKLVPRISPKKTWSGALGGAAASVVVAIVIAKYAGLRDLFAIGLLALVLSIVSQAGDVFESLIKRRFDVKDSSRLIPGHGGLMDRLDGFMAACLVAAVIGLARGGLESPAVGLLVW
jgi:phosphatidate cytidylyltransferase